MVKDILRLFLNLVWLIVCGLALSLTWCALGIILFITVIGIPFGFQCFKFARLTLTPFGKDVELKFMKHPLLNILWAIFVGWEMFIVHLVGALALFVTIVGIPFAIQIIKIAKLALFPFGAEVNNVK